MTHRLEQLWRDEWGRLLALLVRRTRRLDLAEDALAEAFEAAARWPAEAIPDNPAAWLLTTAQRRIIDRLRAEAMAARKQPLLAVELGGRNAPESDGDDLLRLALLAAHPALAAEAGAALTLRLVLGVSTPDIARLFLVSEATMAARLTRAKKKVVAAGVPLALPDPQALPGRLDTVARVAYLAFTAGYAPGSGPDVVRAELAGEAIRLVRLLRASSRAAATSPALVALQALMLLHHSRRDARVGAGGDPVLLPDQDRRRWRRDEINEGSALLGTFTGTTAIRVPGAVAADYLLQALIALEHAKAARAADTDWVTIAGLYRQLDHLTGSAVVRLNRAVAVAEAGEVTSALALLDPLDRTLGRSHRLHAVRADLLSRLGRTDDALAALRLAMQLCRSDAERVVLQRRSRALSGTPVSPPAAGRTAGP